MGAPPMAVDVSQRVVLAFGVVYTLVGAAGFAVTGVSSFAGHEGEHLVGFEVNPLHNVVHLAVGVAGLVAWSDLWRTYLYGWALLVVFGLAVVYGLVAINRNWDLLALNWADNMLHLVSALGGAAIVATARSGDRRPGPPSF